MKEQKTEGIKKFDGIYRGVVENRNDPKTLGRCQIRIFNIHTSKVEQDDENDLEGIPTEHLLWAEPAIPLSNSGRKFWFWNELCA